ncbi:actin-related protein 10-like [Mercenaria mercenaria]|uniref:actin-related protein 10-like n=1 Tax=Mercenaria mercenaria TaxID=6596 RepID=UPI00234ED865|nr:actin-related protein 10-like [Mercenaria mercenaria]
MPLYEGYTSDKNVIIFDFGTAYTKCGVAGEMCPRCVIPSKLKDEKTGKVRKLWVYKTEDELFENLKDFLFNLYFRHLLINPKDRRMVVCESLLCPASFRETLARVLFKHFEVGSVMFTPCHLTAMLMLGTNTGLVMDVGYNEALVVPVYEGIPVLKAIQSLPVASKAVHERSKQILLSDGKVKTGGIEKPVAEQPDCLTEDILEDIKVRCCFTTKFDRAKKIHRVTMFGEDESSLPTPPPSVQYPLDGGSVLHVDGKVREHACEVMFEQDNEQQSIATLLLDAIIQSPIDMRVELSHNIVIIGGTALLPGFLHRIQMELQDLIKQPRYTNVLALKKFKFHQPPAKANYTAWLGGSMFGALDTLASKSVSRDQYKETGSLSDWCNIAS